MVHRFHIGGKQPVTICTRVMPGTEIECISRKPLMLLDAMPGETTGLYVKEFLPRHEYQYHYRVALEDEKDLLFHQVVSSLLIEPGYLDLT